MTDTNATAPAHPFTLTLERIFDASPERVYRAWTDPGMLVEWFAPKPFTVPHAELDVRPGGTSNIVMRDPEGNDYPNPAVFLEVRENERLVMTDAYVRAWEPSAKPFMTMIIDLKPVGDKTHAIYTVRHWSAEDLETHVNMGFHEGWNTCADQLAELLARQGANRQE